MKISELAAHIFSQLTFNFFNRSVFDAIEVALACTFSNISNNSPFRFNRFRSCSNNVLYFDLWIDADFSLEMSELIIQS